MRVSGVSLFLLLLAVQPAGAEIVTAATSKNPQDRIYAEWTNTHPIDNQYRAFDPTGTDPHNKLDCDVSHDSSTNVNTLLNCRTVPR